MKIIPRILPSLLLPLALALPSVAQGATFSVVPYADGTYTVPDANVVFHQPSVAENSNLERDIRSNRDNAQTFQLSSDTIIDKLFITFADAPLTASETTFQFFSLSSLDPLNLNTATVLDTVTFSSSSLGTSAGTLIFDVTDTVAAEGSVFGIRFDSLVSTTTVFKWKQASATNFPEGFRYEGNARATDWDYSIGVVAAIPEPSTYAMIFGALALVGAVVRRRTKR